MLKKNIIIIPIVSLAVLLSAIFPAQATGDLAVEFELTPLFSNVNFLPGNSKTRWVKVTNYGAQTEKVVISATETADAGQLGQVIRLAVKENNITIYDGTLAQFFSAGEIYLTDLAPGATKQYDFLVAFDETAGNNYQGKQLEFDLTVGFQNGEQQTDSKAPQVLAQWAMLAGGQDDSVDAGAQFLPAGQYQVSRNIKICAIVTDPDGEADIDGVDARVFYPQGVAFSQNQAVGRQGCGQLAGTDIRLAKLAKNEGIELFCDQIKNLNDNLPTFKAGNDYGLICADSGQLPTDEAQVYCGEATLAYDDLSGDYRVAVTAHDRSGLAGIATTSFSYLALTAFETDFTALAYGRVKVAEPKKIFGDLVWGNGLATARNTGNTRLALKVEQDDLELGRTNANWNVSYDARLGSSAVFKNYWPEITTVLNEALDLSQSSSLDFGVTVYNFPTAHTGDNFFGKMTLSAEIIPPWTCSQ